MPWSFEIRAPREEIADAIDAAEVQIGHEDDPKESKVRDRQVAQARRAAKALSKEAGTTYSCVLVLATGTADLDTDEPYSGTVSVSASNVPADDSEIPDGA